MNAATIEQRRVEIAKIALNSTDENIINKLFIYAQKLTDGSQGFPLSMTDEELIESVDRAMEQYKNGETISHEEFLEKRTQWL